MHSVDAHIVAMSREDKVAEAIRRSLPSLPAEARAAVEALLAPESLAIITGTLLLWAGSHFFGIGEIVDVILLLVGIAILGKAVWDLAGALASFANRALNAKTEGDLDAAAGYFAHAVMLGGIDVVAALLLRRSARSIAARGRPAIRGMVDAGPAPSSGGRLFYRPTISRPTTLPGGVLGQTDYYGNIAVARTQTLTGQRLTLYHEWVHSVLSPRLVILQRLRGSLAASAYERSALLAYLEEALAESYAQLRVNGIAQAWKGVTFPVGPPGQGYVTVAEMVTEGRAIGTIIVGGHLFRVHLVGRSPAANRRRPDDRERGDRSGASSCRAGRLAVG